MLAKSIQSEVEEQKVEAARSMVAILRSNAEAISARRNVPAEIIQQLADAGLLSLLKPARFGGEQVPLDTAIKVSRELARGDGSVAWVHAVFTTHDHLIGLFPEAVQAEYWASALLPLSASSYAPSGKAVAVDGGWELTGSWSFCSGIDHAGWTVVGAITGMIPGEQPRPDVRLFLVPASDYAIVDDWHVMGLRGTGSKSIALGKVFVPGARVISFDVGHLPPTDVHPDAASEFHYPAWQLLTFGLVGLAGTIARNAYEHSVQAILASAGKPNPLFDSRRAAAGMHLAEASAKIDAADLTYLRALDDTFEMVETGQPLSLEMRVRNRRDQCFSAKLAQEAVSELLNIGGARGIREDSVVQRAYRDLCALMQHPTSSWDATALSYGNVAMGGAPTEAFV